MLKELSNNFYFWFYNSLLSFIFLGFFVIEPWRAVLGDAEITNSLDIVFYWIVTALVFNLIFYIKGFSYLKKIKVSFKKLFLFFILLNLVLMFIWPAGSNDSFSYIYQSRLISHHQVNPYIDTYSNFEHDSFFKEINNKWSARTAPYGPIFLALGGLLTWLGGNSLILTLFLFKLVMVIANILCAWLVYKVFDSIKVFYLYAFNPFILFEFAINAHNDVLLVLFVVLSLGFLLKNNWQGKAWAIGFFIISLLLKFYSLVLLPFIVFRGVLDLKLRKDKLKLIFSGLFFLAVLPTISFWWLADSFQTALSPLLSQSKVMGAISPVIWLFNKVAEMPMGTAIMLSKSLFVIIFALVLVAWLYEKIKLNLYFILAIVLTIFYLTCFTWFMPWYLIFLLIFLIAGYATAKDTVVSKLSLWFIYFISFWGIIYYIVLR